MIPLILSNTQYQNSLKLLSNDMKENRPRDQEPGTRGGGVKNLPNLPMDSTKKLPTVGG